jgi:hypothetical protein
VPPAQDDPPGHRSSHPGLLALGDATELPMQVRRLGVRVESEGEGFDAGAADPFQGVTPSLEDLL